MSTALVARQVEALQRHTLNDAEEIIYNCDKNGWEIVTFDDEKYPNRLRDIPNPPAVLYVDGTLPDIENYAAIAVVGTRKASTYASKALSALTVVLTAVHSRQAAKPLPCSETDSAPIIYSKTRSFAD